MQFHAQGQDAQPGRPSATRVSEHQAAQAIEAAAQAYRKSMRGTFKASTLISGPHADRLRSLGLDPALIAGRVQQLLDTDGGAGTRLGIEFAPGPSCALVSTPTSSLSANHAGTVTKAPVFMVPSSDDDRSRHHVPPSLPATQPLQPQAHSHSYSHPSGHLSS